MPAVLFALAALCYGATWAAIFRLEGFVRLPVALLNGFFIGVVFIIAHDACHRSFMSIGWLNAVVGRLAFLPSLHTFSFWELGHNRLHHGWTNLKAKDYPWAPFSKEEFDALGPERRFVERVGRTFFGVAVYYAVVIWWRHMAFPTAEDRRQVDRRSGRLDRAAALAFFVVETSLAYELERRHGGAGGLWCFLRSFSLAVLIPFLTWNWMAGILTFVQHTHERVRWYDRAEDWSFAEGALRGTVRVVFPRTIDLILHNVMFHTAHHVDTRIPLYRLPRAQGAVEGAHEADVVRTPFAVGSVLDTMRRCKLYDYRRHEWLDFAGHPTTGEHYVVPDATDQYVFPDVKGPSI